MIEQRLLPHEFKIVGYRANLIAYAIMVMSVKTDMRFPWRRTWANQEVPAEIDHLRAEVRRLRADRNEWRALAVWLIGLMCNECRRWLRQ